MLDAQTQGITAAPASNRLRWNRATICAVRRGAAGELHVAYCPGLLFRGLGPVTRIGWGLDDGNLNIETVHTYPDEGRGVRSLTCFRFEEGR